MRQNKVHLASHPWYYYPVSRTRHSQYPASCIQKKNTFSFPSWYFQPVYRQTYPTQNKWSSDVINNCTMLQIADSAHLTRLQLCQASPTKVMSSIGLLKRSCPISGKGNSCPALRKLTRLCTVVFFPTKSSYIFSYVIPINEDTGSYVRTTDTYFAVNQPTRSHTIEVNLTLRKLVICTLYELSNIQSKTKTKK